MKTLFIGQKLTYLQLADSTNSYAAELLKENKEPEGAVIYSFNQQNGRGQRGNTWESKPNENVAFSLILHPSFLPPEHQFVLTKIISLAVYDLMTEILKNSDITHQIKIKWPNDIYVNKKKIAGILIENSLANNSIKNSIIGIGVNVNQTIFANLNATSIKLTTGKTIDLMIIVEKLCESIEARYLQLKTNKQEGIDNEYLQHLYQLNEWKNYSSSNEIFEGRIIGVTAFGKLKVEVKPNDAIKEYFLKEIKFE